MEKFDHCPACNAELDDSTHCPACGSAVPGRESNDPPDSGESVVDLGFEVVQGAGIAEDDFMSPPPAPAPPPKPPEAPTIPTPPPELPKQESNGIELEALVDPGALQEASQAADSAGAGIELESMISVPEQPVNPPSQPTAPPAVDDVDLSLDLDLELVEPEAAKAPPPVAPEKNTVRESKRQTGEAPRSSTSSPPRSTEERALDSDSESPASTGTEKKKKMGLFGFLGRAALVLGVVLGSLAVAYPPGIGMLGDFVAGIPHMLGPKGVRHVTNMLVDPMEVYVEDNLFGIILAGERLEIPVRAGVDLRVRLIKPEQATGVRAGDDIEFPLTDPIVAGDDEQYRIDSHSGEVWIFAPLISNPTGRDMIALINAGTARARPCNCIIPAGATDHHIGYYAFEAGLRIRFVDVGSEYNSRSYREVRDVTADVAAGTGTVNVRIPLR
jgi:hypothetical protein